MKKCLLALLFALTLTACQKQDEPTQSKTQTAAESTVTQTQSLPETTVTPSEPAALKSLFNEPIEATRIERPSAALPFWRDAAGGSRPALVLYSIHPFLQPLADEQTEELRELVATGTPEIFHQRGSYFRVDPALLPTQTVSTALDSNLFSELVWIIPSTSTPDQLSLDQFRSQVVEAGFLTEEEGAQLTMNEGSFTGTVRGLPFKAIHHMAIQELDSPAIVHLDLSFFKGMYTNEIKTPLYPLLSQVASDLKPLNWQVHAVTLSYSTAESELSLETRFMINRFAELLGNPAMLEQDMPKAWNLHSEALYTINFFLETKVTELYERAIKEAPEDAAVLYGLALRKLRDNNLGEALSLIDRAVAQDSGYAYEYLSLADRAGQSNDLQNALMLLEKGRPYFKDNPFIDVQRANLLLNMGKLEEGRALIRELQKLPWSERVHANARKSLANMLAWEPQDPASSPNEDSKQ